VVFAQLDGASALPVCAAALAEYPDDLVTAYQLARVHHRLGDVDEALKGYKALSDKGYAVASRGISILIEEDSTGRLAKQMGSVAEWIEKARQQGDLEAIWNNAAQLALSDDARAHTGEILADMATTGVANRASAVLVVFQRAAQRAQSPEQKANALFFGLLGLDWAATVEDPAPVQYAADRPFARELVQDYAASLPPASVVKVYREARAWRADGARP
jgi:hypothetical protein